MFLSVVIPAYNEEERLPIMLKECIEYLEERFPKDYEVIVVDDGSKDKTTKVGLVRKILLILKNISSEFYLYGGHLTVSLS